MMRGQRMMPSKQKTTVKFSAPFPPTKKDNMSMWDLISKVSQDRSEEKAKEICPTFLGFKHMIYDSNGKRSTNPLLKSITTEYGKKMGGSRKRVKKAGTWSSGESFMRWRRRQPVSDLRRGLSRKNDLRAVLNRSKPDLRSTLGPLKMKLKKSKKGYSIV
jgi:hypothetical protein